MNKDLIQQFSILQAYFKSKNDTGRNIAYGKVVSGLRTIGDKVRNISQVKNIPGIGPAAIKKVKEYLDTGKIEAVEDAKAEIQKGKKLSLKETATELFQTVWGVGPKKADQLYESGVRTLEELERRKYSLLTRAQIIGLKYREELLVPLPRALITSVYVVMMYHFNKKYGKGKFDMIFAGSYRRGAKESGDIDCVISSNSFTLSDAVELLKSEGVVTDVLSMRTEKFMGIGHCPKGFGNHFRLDIEFVDQADLGSSLLYFTGSKGTNIYMRVAAKKKGMVLSQHGLFSASTGKKLLQSPTEEDIFKKLDIPYISPENR
jgi:DNA polymerase/3'-5' exonuclease PolX